jgi:hypothetical protein
MKYFIILLLFNLKQNISAQNIVTITSDSWSSGQDWENKYKFDLTNSLTIGQLVNAAGEKFDFNIKFGKNIALKKYYFMTEVIGSLNYTIKGDIQLIAGNGTIITCSNRGLRLRSDDISGWSKELFFLTPSEFLTIEKYGFKSMTVPINFVLNEGAKPYIFDGFYIKFDLGDKDGTAKEKEKIEQQIRDDYAKKQAIKRFTNGSQFGQGQNGRN